MQSALAPGDRDPFAWTFDCTNKAELEKHCHSAVACIDDIVTWALACEFRLIPMLYGRFFRHDYPDHLVPSDHELAEFSGLKGGAWPNGKRPKFVAKTMQGFVERRLSAAHLFVDPINDRWHFWHFNQRDLQEYRNHWRGGPHIHVISWLTEPNADPYQLALEFKTSKKPIHRGLHLRCAGWHQNEAGAR